MSFEGEQHVSKSDRMERLRIELTANDQEHLLQFLEDLNQHQQEEFINTLLNLNLREIGELYKRASESIGRKLLDDRLEPVPKFQFESHENMSAAKLKVYYERGLKEISEGNVAVILMAGGQGTRLGVTFPKGMFDLGLESSATLYKLQAGRILKLTEIANRMYNKSGVIRWYIMTSDFTSELTRRYFEQNNYFGLSAENVIIFEQDLLPCFDFNGKILLEDRNKLALAPDGNGGIYQALKTNKVLDDFKSKHIKYVHVHSVDNILVKVADPTFIGYCVEKNADCGNKVVQKATPTEAVGVVCLVDDKFQVVEYSEITNETAHKTNPDGTLVFNAGNICNHFFTTNFLQKVADVPMRLHVAKKKIPHLNTMGEMVKPSAPNGIKIEKFVFDVFEFSDNFVIWEVPRYSEFSAMKNSDDIGFDCPKTARRDLYNLHNKYLRDVGAVIHGDVEISTTLSYGGEGLEHYAGKTIVGPILLK